MVLSCANLQVDQWLDYAAFLTAGPGLEAACAALDTYLAFRSFLVGFNLTIADLACWGQLESMPQCTSLMVRDACYVDSLLWAVPAAGAAVIYAQWPADLA